MEGKTHRLGGTVGALAGYLVLYESGNLLPSEQVSPALQFLVIYTAGIYGGVWSDNDHHWQSSPLNDPFSWVQNKLLHIFNKPFNKMDEQLSYNEKRNSLLYKMLDFLACKHRSWQTHSEFTLGLIYLLWKMQYLPFFTGYLDSTLFKLIMTGFGLGVMSHIFLDMLTTEGVRWAFGVFLYTFTSGKVPKALCTIRIVPASTKFKTGSPWEMFVRKLLYSVQYGLILVVLLLPFGIDVLETLGRLFPYS